MVGNIFLSLNGTDSLANYEPQLRSITVPFRRGLRKDKWQFAIEDVITTGQRACHLSNGLAQAVRSRFGSSFWFIVRFEIKIGQILEFLVVPSRIVVHSAPINQKPRASLPNRHKIPNDFDFPTVVAWNFTSPVLGNHLTDLVVLWLKMKVFSQVEYWLGY